MAGSGVFRRFTLEEIGGISADFEDKHPSEVVRWALDTFGDKVALASSFGGAAGAVLVDIAAKLDSGVRIFYLDTEFLFPETYALVDETAKRYGVQPVPYKSVLDPQAQAAVHGADLWSTDPDRCCDLRKVEPNQRALDGLDAWITGIRRDQAATRGEIGIVEWNEKFGLIKVNPLAGWEKKQVWEYIFANKVPYNPLLDQGYKSIGCTHCTRPTATGEDERAGRWSGTDKTECGLHS